VIAAGNADRVPSLMNISRTAVAGVLLLEPPRFSDARGSLYESYNERDFAAAVGVAPTFVQENHTTSSKNVLRGLHYQVPHAQGKLVRATAGSVYDVAVDLRKDSPTFGRWVAHTLSADKPQLLWIPPGFAHGFLVLSERAEVAYKLTAYWSSAEERCIAWDDPTLAIAWPLAGLPLVSERDRHGVSFENAGSYT
jgi:dTDP-4-dehydrorhamnose 3,5-epimerase